MPGTESSTWVDPHHRDDETDTTPDAAAVLSLLDDDYARQILVALQDTSRPARELLEICEASRPTVYRRLDQLEEAGFITAETAIHPDGHHRDEFSPQVDSITLTLDGDGFTADTKKDPSGH